MNEDTQLSANHHTSSEANYNILEVSWNSHFWSSRWKLIYILLWRQVGTLKIPEGCCSNLDSKFTPAFRHLEANYFSGPDSNFTIGSIGVDAFWDSFRFSLRTNYYWGSYLQLLVWSSKSLQDLILRLGCQSWPLIFHGPCLRLGYVREGKLGLLEMTGLFPHWLGFFVFRGPLRTSAQWHRRSQV